MTSQYSSTMRMHYNMFHIILDVRLQARLIMSNGMSFYKCYNHYLPSFSSTVVRHMVRRVLILRANMNE